MVLLDNRFAISLLILVFNLQIIFAQAVAEEQLRKYRVIFYNVENFFDAKVDTLTDYNEFTPEGERFWNYSRYKTKQNQVYKVITAIGQWQSPAIVAFAEIENQFVLNNLISNTPLWNQNYQVLHFESIDHRGIDVGLIYNNKQVHLISAKPIRLKDVTGEALATRDILYAKFLLGQDTLHLLVNHWPSRYGGTLQTAYLREMAATKLNLILDSICEAVDQPNILVMGDFNDDPEDISMKLITDRRETCRLVNLDLIPTDYPVKGTLKYKSEWNSFDQILCTEYLLQDQSDISIKERTASVFSPLFLLETDEKYMGMQPNRTYIGFKYHGGFSDHLPVYVDIYSDKKQ